MLEGDEILDVAQETGYRLCRMANEEVMEKIQEERQLVFSVTWDLNNNRRLYMCMQDGQLKTIDLDVPQHYESNFGRVVPPADLNGPGQFSDGAECLVHDFNVRFRRFIGPHEPPEPDRPINYHWDKICSIPGRPDELFFLLGISKSIMYTSLPAPLESPYPPKPLLSSITRGDFTGFIYGTPVMQLCSHSCRVTALATSPRGQLLASGDEQGNVRIIMLQLLQEMTGRSAANTSPTHGIATPTSHHSHASHFSSPAMHLLRHNQYHQHMQRGDTNNPGMPNTPRSMAATNQYISLVNGNAAGGDGAGSKGFRRPFQANYDLTKSCHKGPIFSLAWLPMIENYQKRPVFGLITGSADRVVRIWRIETSTVHGVNFTPCMVLDTLSTHILSLSVLRTRSYEEDEDWEEVERPAVQVYISAGTNLGTVHVWKIPMQEIQYRLSTPPNNPGAIASSSNNVNNLSSGVPSATGVGSPTHGFGQIQPTTQFVPPTGGTGASRALSKVVTVSNNNNDMLNNNTNSNAMVTPMLDDGRYLISVLQPTDQPIIHVSLTNISGEMKRLSHFSGEVVLAASDTQGRVNVYASDDGKLSIGNNMDLGNPGGNSKDDVFMLTSAQQATDFYLKQMRLKYESRQLERSNRQQQQFIPTPAGTLDFKENSRQRQTHLAESLGETIESFVPIKHHIYKNVVVACAFSTGQMMTTTMSGYEQGGGYGYEKGGELVVCTMRGHVRVYNDLLARDYHKKFLQTNQRDMLDADWAQLQAQYESDLDSSDNEQDQPFKNMANVDPNVHPNQMRAPKPLQNTSGEPFILHMPPSIPVLTKNKSNLAPKPVTNTINNSTSAAENAGLVASSMSNNQNNSSNYRTTKRSEKSNALQDSQELDLLPPPSPPPCPPVVSSLVSKDHADEEGEDAHAPRPRRSVPTPTQPTAKKTSSLLKPTAAFAAKTRLDKETTQKTIDNAKKVISNNNKNNKKHDSMDAGDGMSVVSSVSKATGVTGFTGISATGSGRSSAGGSVRGRPTEAEIAHDEHLQELQDLLPYPVTFQKSPGVNTDNSNVQDEEDDEEDDEEGYTKQQRLIMKQLAASEALTRQNPFSAPSLHSTRHVEQVVQTLSEKISSNKVPTSKENDLQEPDYFNHPETSAEIALLEDKWETLTVSTVQTTQSDRLRALQAVQRHYKRRQHQQKGGENENNEDLYIPAAQYLDAKDQEKLFSAFAANNRTSKRPVTGIWKKSAPVIAPDYLARKQHFALQAADLSIFNQSQRKATKTLTTAAGDNSRSKVRLSLFHEANVTTNNNKFILKRLRYNQQSGMYSPNGDRQVDQKAFDEEEDNMFQDEEDERGEDENAFVWEMNLQDLFPVSQNGFSSINKFHGNNNGLYFQNDNEEFDEVNEEEEEIYIIQKQIQDRAAWQSVVTSASIGALTFS